MKPTVQGSTITRVTQNLQYNEIAKSVIYFQFDDYLCDEPSVVQDTRQRRPLEDGALIHVNVIPCHFLASQRAIAVNTATTTPLHGTSERITRQSMLRSMHSTKLQRVSPSNSSNKNSTALTFGNTDDNVFLQDCDEVKTQMEKMSKLHLLSLWSGPASCLNMPD